MLYHRDTNCVPLTSPFNELAPVGMLGGRGLCSSFRGKIALVGGRTRALGENKRSHYNKPSDQKSFVMYYFVVFLLFFLAPSCALNNEDLPYAGVEPDVQPKEHAGHLDTLRERSTPLNSTREYLQERMRNNLGDSIAHLEQKQATGTSCVVVVRGGEAEGEEGGSPRMVVLPAAGACAGPMERTQAIRAQGKLLNYNCEINRIPYYPDGNSSAPIQVLGPSSLK